MLVFLLPVYSSASSACLFSAIFKMQYFLSFISEQKHKHPLGLFLKLVSFFSLLPVSLFLFCCLSLVLPFPRHQLTAIPFSPLSRTNKQCSRLRHEGWLSAQRVQLVSISRQGGKDDRERCWNESSVWAPRLFSLSY